MGRLQVILGALVCAWLAGCGGGGANSSSPVDAPRVVPGTAKFHVDVSTGQVTISSPSATSGSRAVMLGGAVGFESSTLLDQPGNTGLRILNVRVTNRWVQDIGRQPDGRVTGLRVLFSPFVPAQTFDSLRPKVTVSSLAGSGVDADVDGPYATAAFRVPTGVAVAPDGTVFVSDAGAHRIRQLSGGFVSTLAGAGIFGSAPGVGVAATFGGPAGIAWDPADNSLVVADRTGHRLRRVTRDGRVSLIAGTGVAGGADGAGDVATLNGPAGVTVGDDGVIYVTESGGNRVRRVVRTGADPSRAGDYAVRLVAGDGTAGLRDGVGTGARFNRPAGVAVLRGNLYVADTNNDCVRLVTTDGAVATIAGAGAQSSLDGDGQTCFLGRPFGVVAAGDGLVVTEAAGRRVRQLRLKGDGTAGPASRTSWLVQTLAGDTTDAISNTIPSLVDGDGTVATFFQPQMVAVTAAGDLLVADASFRRIRLVTPPNGLFDVGTPGGAGDATQVRLANGDGVIPSSIFGANLPFVSYPGVLAPGANTTPRAWSFAVPAGVTAFEFMVTVEADTAVPAPPEAVLNTGATVLGSPDVRVRTLAGGDLPGYLDGTFSAARFANLGLAARDGLGNVYVADTSSDTIRCLGANGRVSTMVALGDPFGVAATQDGNTVYCTEGLGHKVRRASFTGTDRTNSAHWTVATIAGTGTAGNVNGPGNTATLNGPIGVALDAAENLYVAEVSNRIRLLRFVGGDRRVAANWRVLLVAGDLSAVNGASGSTNGTGSAARFQTPFGIVVDAAGDLFVTEINGHRVRKITNPGGSAGGVVSTLAGGTQGAADGTGGAARFGQPRGIAIDGSGYLYVAEFLNRRVRRVSPAGEVTTVAGSGLATHTDGTGAGAGFAGLTGIVADDAGNLYATDDRSVRLVQRTLSGVVP
ncbi:MAG: hypothetical protein HYU66_24870 [Armatimonadetes bacterium]|nr:hypothetical protein [Armatimonadota bacterium]